MPTSRGPGRLRPRRRRKVRGLLVRLALFLRGPPLRFGLCARARGDVAAGNAGRFRPGSQACHAAGRRDERRVGLRLRFVAAARTPVGVREGRLLGVGPGGARRLRKDDRDRRVVPGLRNHLREQVLLGPRLDARHREHEDDEQQVEDDRDEDAALDREGPDVVLLEAGELGDRAVRDRAVGQQGAARRLEPCGPLVHEGHALARPEREHRFRCRLGLRHGSALAGEPPEHAPHGRPIALRAPPRFPAPDRSRWPGCRACSGPAVRRLRRSRRSPASRRPRPCRRSASAAARRLLQSSCAETAGLLLRARTRNSPRASGAPDLHNTGFRAGILGIVDFRPWTRSRPRDSSPGRSTWRCWAPSSCTAFCLPRPAPE